MTSSWTLGTDGFLAEADSIYHSRWFIIFLSTYFSNEIDCLHHKSIGAQSTNCTSSIYIIHYTQDNIACPNINPDLPVWRCIQSWRAHEPPGTPWGPPGRQACLHSGGPRSRSFLSDGPRTAADGTPASTAPRGSPPCYTHKVITRSL